MAISPSIQPVSIYPGEANQNSLHICWMLHNACNNRCTYCSKANWGGDARWLTLDGLQMFWQQVRSHYKKDHIHVSFTGGEPTLCPDFAKLCRLLKDDGCDLGMTSNGGYDLKIWQETRDAFNWLCLSYHSEFTKDDHFLKVIELMSAHTRVAVRLMMHKQEKYWRRAVEFGEKIKQLPDGAPIFVEYVPLQDDFGLSPRPAIYESWQNEFFATHSHFTHGGSSPEIGDRLNTIRDVWDYQVLYSDGSRAFCRPNELVTNGQVNFKNWSCHAGVDMLFVNALGEIFRGGCRVGGQIGHIFDKEIRFPSQPVVCPKDFCFCGTDIQVKKYSSGLDLHDGK